MLRTTRHFGEVYVRSLYSEVNRKARATYIAIFGRWARSMRDPYQRKVSKSWTRKNSSISSPFRWMLLCSLQQQWHGSRHFVSQEAQRLWLSSQGRLRRMSQKPLLRGSQRKERRRRQGTRGFVPVQSATSQRTKFGLSLNQSQAILVTSAVRQVVRTIWIARAVGVTLVISPPTRRRISVQVTLANRVASMAPALAQEVPVQVVVATTVGVPLTAAPASAGVTKQQTAATNAWFAQITVSVAVIPAPRPARPIVEEGVTRIRMSA